MSQEPQRIVIPEEYDEDGRLKIDKERDKPPLGKKVASCVFIKFDDGVLKIVGIRDTDPLKNKGRNFQLPGGRARVRSQEEEDAIKVARDESFEEAGVCYEVLDDETSEKIHIEVPEENFEPTCHVIHHHQPLRDDSGEPIMIRVGSRSVQKRGDVFRFVFSHVGDVFIQETDDEDAKEPRWFTLDEVVDSTARSWELNQKLRVLRNKKRNSKESPEDADTENELRYRRELDEVIEQGTWSISHVVLLVQTIIYLSDGFKAYCRRELNDIWDLHFFGMLAKMAKDDIKVYYALEDLTGTTKMIGGRELDLLSIMSEIQGSELEAGEFLARGFTFEPLNALTYFCPEIP